MVEADEVVEEGALSKLLVRLKLEERDGVFKDRGIEYVTISQREAV